MKNIIFATDDCYDFRYPSTYVMAACTKKGDKIYAGMRHNISIKAMVNDGLDARECEQGFIDNHGNFLTREEAFILATKTGQKQRSTGGGDVLFSEDLW